MNALSGDLNYTTFFYILAALLILIGFVLLARKGSNRSIYAKNTNGVIISGDGNKVEQTNSNSPSNDQAKLWWKKVGSFITWLMAPAGLILALLTFLSDKS